MKIAIHYRNNSFATRWIDYCKLNNVEYKIVNAYDSNIVEQVSDCDAFVWHHHQSNYKDCLFAKQLLYSLQMSGKKVFPDFNTGWHFDDKVGQKYLLEAIEAPLVKTEVFYTEREALSWIDNATFPKVFKLRGGAGAINVSLVHSSQQARKLVKKAFSEGFSQYGCKAHIKEAWRKWKKGEAPFVSILRPIRYALKKYPTEFAHYRGNEIGYVYFQDFIPNNDFDIRVIVIGNRAFAIKRVCREHDFRASGSGNILYSKNEIDEHCVRESFRIATQLHTQCIGYDWVFGYNHTPMIVEVGYGFAVPVYDPCPGYWTSDMQWHEGRFNPQYWMIEDLIQTLKE